MTRFTKVTDALLRFSMWSLWLLSFWQGHNEQYAHAAWDVGLACFAALLLLLDREPTQQTTIHYHSPQSSERRRV